MWYPSVEASGEKIAPMRAPWIRSRRDGFSLLSWTTSAPINGGRTAPASALLEAPCPKLTSLPTSGTRIMELKTSADRHDRHLIVQLLVPHEGGNEEKPSAHRGSSEVAAEYLRPDRFRRGEPLLHAVFKAGLRQRPFHHLQVGDRPRVVRVDFRAVWYASCASTYRSSS